MSEDNNALLTTGNFIHAFITQDLGDQTDKLITRFPPEPNGYLHIGHAKSILFNYGLAVHYGGKFNLRFDDTNPAKEEMGFVNGIIDDVKWLCGDSWEERIYYASDYFDTLYDCAVTLIKKGLAFVCDMTADEIKATRGTLSSPGTDSPYRNRSVEENLDLFERMKNGEFPDGAKTLRAKVDMKSPNINMRDPVIYRIAKIPHHNSGDKWCIYPMYDFAHPIEDAIEEITHSICTLEFEDHRPIYEFYINNLDFPVKPRQIEFAKMYLTNSVTGKRYCKQIVAEKEVDGWDDPRMVTIVGLRRRGVTASAIRAFCEKIGMSKATNRVDIALFEHCIREDLKPVCKTVMAVLDPVKVIITNYPEGQTEMMEIENHVENEALGTRMVPFSRELYVERDDFMEDAPKKFHRLTIGQEVRLKGAYFVTCTGVNKDENGNITEILCTYDPETKSGSGFTGRKVKGTIHWLSAETAVKCSARLYDYLVFDDETAESGIRKNENSLTVMENCYIEPYVKEISRDERLQFLRHGYFYPDHKLSTESEICYNRIVSLKSSYNPAN